MAYAKKIKVFGKTIGWNVFFSHNEAEGIGDGHLAVAQLLSGVTPAAVTGIIAGGGLAWKALCKTGGHDGVKAVVALIPAPTVVLWPR
jgi:hypothetical protein